MHTLSYRCSKIPGRKLIYHTIVKADEHGNRKGLVLTTNLKEPGSMCPFRLQLLVTGLREVYLLQEGQEPHFCGIHAAIL